MSLRRYAAVFRTGSWACYAQRLKNLNTEGRDISICSNNQASRVTQGGTLVRVAERNNLYFLWVPEQTYIRGN